MLTELQNSHYNIYNEALTNKKELSTLDSTLVFLSSNAFYELDSLVLLTNNNKIHGTYSLCRTILEKLIYMKYILEENLDLCQDSGHKKFKLFSAQQPFMECSTSQADCQSEKSL